MHEARRTAPLTSSTEAARINAGSVKQNFNLYTLLELSALSQPSPEEILLHISSFRP